MALSSIEASYVALSKLGTEAQWLMKLIRELKAVQKGKLPGVKDAPVLCSDNNVAPKAKHININQFKVRDKYEASNLQLARVATKDNVADIFTKALVKGTNKRAVANGTYGDEDGGSFWQSFIAAEDWRQYI